MNGRRGSTAVRLTLATAATGILLPIVLAVVGIDFLNTRNLLPVLVPLTAVAAAGFAALLGPPLGAVVCGGLIAVFALSSAGRYPSGLPAPRLP